MTQATTIERLRPHAFALVPGLLAVALMLVWAVHDGGYDQDTWYWGALAFLALVTAIVIAGGVRPVALSRSTGVALLAFALYTAWSYVSIAWAHSPGDALDGSNRTLLYFLVYTAMVLLPWTTRTALLAQLVFVIGVGVIAIVLLFRLAAADHIANLVIGGRLGAPTGYFNAAAALFTIEALTGVALAARRELPGPLRGLLVAFACAGLQLGVIVQSRGWLFTLPLIAVVAIAIVPDRVRVALTAAVPVVATLVPVHRLLDVYKAVSGTALDHAAARAGQAGLLGCAAALFVGTLLAWVDSLLPAPPNALRRRLLGALVIVVAIVGVAAGAQAATHGHPIQFIKRQWNGFSHVQQSYGGSHFTDVGSGRYDFWRVALDAFVTHPIGGLGQDNFVEYYVPRRRTGEEPSWTHSIELRLLAHTGAVGFALFAIFLVAALIAVIPARRRGGLDAAVAAVALLPLVVWLVHGSIDWFWEIPALTGPALGFLAMAGALSRSGQVAGSAAAVATGSGTAFPDTRTAAGDSPDAGTPAAGESPDAGTPTGESPDAGTAAAGESPDAGIPATDSPDARADSADATSSPSARRLPRVLIGLGGALLLVTATVVLAFPYLSVREVSIATDLRGVDPARALARLDTAVKLNPLNAVPGRLAGTIALQTGRYTIALERFNQATSRDPGGWFGWLGAGLAASALGNPQLARHNFEVAASIKHHDPLIDEALARVDTAHPLSPIKALQMLVIRT